MCFSYFPIYFILNCTLDLFLLSVLCSLLTFYSSDHHKLLNFAQLLRAMIYIWIKYYVKVINRLVLKTSRLGCISEIFKCWLHSIFFWPVKLMETSNTFKMWFFSFTVRASLRLRWIMHWFSLTVWTSVFWLERNPEITSSIDIYVVHVHLILDQINPLKIKNLNLKNLKWLLKSNHCYSSGCFSSIFKKMFLFMSEMNLSVFCFQPLFFSLHGLTDL